jgi:small-conductance mechanosensitive channel
VPSTNRKILEGFLMDADIIKDEIRNIREQLLMQQKEILETHKILQSSVEQQKQTQKVLDAFSEDLKEILKAATCCEMNKKDIESINKRLSKVEDSKTWMYRLIVGAVITGVLGIFLEYNRTVNIQNLRNELVQEQKKLTEKQEETTEKVEEQVEKVTEKQEEVQKQQQPTQVVIQPVDQNGKPISEPMVIDPQRQTTTVPVKMPQPSETDKKGE